VRHSSRVSERFPRCDVALRLDHPGCSAGRDRRLGVSGHWALPPGRRSRRRRFTIYAIGNDSRFGTGSSGCLPRNPGRLPAAAFRRFPRRLGRGLKPAARPTEGCRVSRRTTCLGMNIAPTRGGRWAREKETDEMRPHRVLAFDPVDAEGSSRQRERGPGRGSIGREPSTRGGAECACTQGTSPGARANLCASVSTRARPCVGLARHGRHVAITAPAARLGDLGGRAGARSQRGDRKTAGANVGARYWGPGVFREALRQALVAGTVLRMSRSTFALRDNE